MSQQQPTVHQYPTAAELVAATADSLVDAISSAQAERGSASIVVTGGSNGIALLRALRTAPIDWATVSVWFGDDRFVPADDDDRNFRQAREALFDHVEIPPHNLHPMPASDGPDDLPAAAAHYAAELSSASASGPTPLFDVHLLGMGGEGHINSLFPHTDAVAERTEMVVPVDDSPKPPAQRVSLTLPAVNRSRHVWFLVAGADKAEAVAAGVNGADARDWPCAGAHGTVQTRWFIDDAAAQNLT